MSCLMNASFSNLKPRSWFKILLFVALTGAISRATGALALSHAWTPREWAIGLMSLLTLVAGVAWFEEVRGSRNLTLDPFGEEASGAGTLAANLLREMDPAREEELLLVLSIEQPEALDHLRSGRVVFADLPSHDPGAVKAALRECSPAEVAAALHGQSDSLQACIRDWAGLDSAPETPADEPPARLRRKIVEGVEAHYLRMGIQDFARRTHQR
jgi:hypothetical protein